MSAARFGFNRTGNASILIPTKSELDTWLGTTMAIGGFGGVAITFLLIVMLTSGKVTTVSGKLIIQLESVELFMCVVENLLSNVPLYLKQTGHTVHIHCPAAHFSLLSLSFVANWAAAVLAINRFIAIILPHQYRILNRKRSAVTMLLWPWFFVLTTSIPLYIQRDITVDMLSSGACGVSRVLGPTLSVVGSLNSYVPYTLVGLSYLAIFLKQKLVFGTPVMPDRQVVRDAVMRKRLAMARVLFCSFVWYCLCQLPAPIVDTMYPRARMRDDRFVMWLRTTWVLGYAINPLFFFAMSRDYRQGARRLLKKIGLLMSAGVQDSELKDASSRTRSNSGHRMMLSSFKVETKF